MYLLDNKDSGRYSLFSVISVCAVSAISDENEDNAVCRSAKKKNFRFDAASPNFVSELPTILIQKPKISPFGCIIRGNKIKR